jgi:MoaA/NifB/PqqE/SkfB family radical SAM enzyme
MSSLYWDDFERRIEETVTSIKNKTTPKIRRVSVFITNKCNFRCKYCNVNFGSKEMPRDKFIDIVEKYGKDSIIHITGGEPSTVDWLYDTIDKYKDVRFHLNTNCFIAPPQNIKRLKVSLDSCNHDYFNELVGNVHAFDNVVENIIKGCEYTTTSVTCVLSKENYKHAPKIIHYVNSKFPKLYAIFFSVYKGSNERFAFGDYESNDFFSNVKPVMESLMNKESLNLFKETIDNKIRIMKNVRFPENDLTIPCYLSMSEMVFDYDGNECSCSHLYRDGIIKLDNVKTGKCRYGCNRRLVMFNEEVENKLKDSK